MSVFEQSTQLPVASNLDSIGFCAVWTEKNVAISNPFACVPEHGATQSSCNLAFAGMSFQKLWYALLVEWPSAIGELVTEVFLDAKACSEISFFSCLTSGGCVNLC
jgi:hypothetical protein